jgi:hypothetical protein
LEQQAEKEQLQEGRDQGHSHQGLQGGVR